MLKISEYSNHMMKNSFDIPNPVIKKPKKYIIVSDNVFFSLYSKKNNLNSFDMGEYNETNEKIKIAECLEKIKFKNKEEIINNLVYEKTIQLDTINILCMHYKFNLVMIKNRTYVKMKYADDTSPFLYINDNGQYLENPPDIQSLLEINIEKPLRTVSYYKLGDLQEIAVKLKIDIEKKKKQELYDSIKMVLSTLYKIE
jgi:hypothetical protein